MAAALTYQSGPRKSDKRTVLLEDVRSTVVLLPTGRMEIMVGKQLHGTACRHAFWAEVLGTDPDSDDFAVPADQVVQIARWRSQSAPNTRWPSERAAADPGQERASCSCLPLRQLRRAAGRACGSPGGAGLRRRKRTPLRPRPPDAGHSAQVRERHVCAAAGATARRLAKTSGRATGWSRAVTTTASRTASGRPARERGTPKHV